MELSSLKKDNLFLILLIIVIILGLYVRLFDFSQTGYYGDDMTTIPTGLLWFYPHDYYPGLAGQGEPAFGNLIIGSFCMLSGEDFSKVTKIQPMFYPGREELIGEAMTNAEPYCKSSVYVFGILFFLIISLFSILLLPRYSAFFSISFFAFYPPILYYGKWIHVDIIGYLFIVLGLLFLWLAYKEERASKKELIYFVLGFGSLGLALATKLPNAIYLLFGLFIILEKYKYEALSLLKKILKLSFEINQENLNKKSFYKTILLSGISYLFFLLIPLEFSLKNLFLVLQKYRLVNPERSGLAINTSLLNDISDFLLNTTMLNMLIFIFAFYILFRLFRTKRTTYENFILYLFSFFLLAVILFPAVNYLRIFNAFFFGLIFLMSLTFSGRDYSLNSLVKKKSLVLAVLVVLTISSGYIAFKDSPYYVVKNPVVCKLNSGVCESVTPIDFYGFSAKQTAEYLSTILEDNETFLPQSVILYYTRRDEGYPHYIFVEQVNKLAGRNPTLEEYIRYFRPNGRIVRYYLLNPNKPSAERDLLYDKYNPIHTIVLNNKNTVMVYDLKSIFQQYYR